MPKLVIKVSTNKLGSEVKRVIDIDEEVLEDEKGLEGIISDNVTEMIYVDHEVIDD